MDRLARDNATAQETHKVASAMLDRIDQHAKVQDEHPDLGHCTIADEAVVELAMQVQFFIAQLVSQAIDAGSERDVVMEDEQLSVALEKAFRDWSTSTMLDERKGIETDAGHFGGI